MILRYVSAEMLTVMWKAPGWVNLLFVMALSRRCTPAVTAITWKVWNATSLEIREMGR